MKRKKVYFITVVVGFAICMVGVIFGSRLVFQRTCERRTTPWSDLGTADDDEYRILIDKLYDSCNGEKQLYIVHGADHTENYRKDPGGYEKIVTKFIEERLRQKKCQTPGTKP